MFIKYNECNVHPVRPLKKEPRLCRYCCTCDNYLLLLQLQEKLDQLLSEYEKEAGNIDAAIKKEMQKNQGKNASKTAR